MKKADIIKRGNELLERYNKRKFIFEFMTFIPNIDIKKFDKIKIFNMSRKKAVLEMCLSVLEKQIVIDYILDVENAINELENKKDSFRTEKQLNNLKYIKIETLRMLLTRKITVLKELQSKQAFEYLEDLQDDEYNNRFKLSYARKNDEIINEEDIF